MNNLPFSISAICFFRNIAKDSVVSSFVNLIVLLGKITTFEAVLNAYVNFINVFLEEDERRNLYLYLKKLIYSDENILGKDVSNDDKECAEYELSLFDKLLLYDCESIKKVMHRKFPDKSEIISNLPVYYTEGALPFDINDVKKSYKEKGFGIFYDSRIFKFDGNRTITPVRNFNTLSFKDLKNYKYQQDVIKKNTEAFLNGKKANNILLYGDRGCGKSSTVKALIKEFPVNSLKIIQITKESIVHLDYLFEKITKQPSRFIIFADDLTFDEGDKNFSLAKASLEGSFSDLPENAIIYATTNRIHMVKESFKSREGDEVHINDTIDESVSLSDRFGIILTFSLLTKPEFLDIVEKIAKDYKIKANDKLFRKAEEFVALKGIRTPRCARQFINDYIAGLT